MISRKGRYLIFGIILLLGLGGILAVFLQSFETESAVVNIALKKDGKTYLFSAMGSFIVDSQIADNKSPSTLGFIQLFNDDGLFVAPSKTKEIANLLGGNYKIYPFQEKSYDGYLTAGEGAIFDQSFENESTLNIGQQIRLNTVRITHPTTKKVFEIVWEWNPKTRENKAIKNCELKSFWIGTTYQPGERVTSSEDFIMVDLADLVDFFNNGSKLEYNSEQEILYIIEK